MEIQLIRSATLRLSLAGRHYLVDPWLAAQGAGRTYAGRDRSPLVDLPMDAEEIVAGVDAVLVSHLHSDHFDEAACAALADDARILCAARDADPIRARGFTDVVAIDAGFRDGAVDITLAPGRHGPDEVLADMGDASGFVFRADAEPVLYWAGDTIFCDEVRRTIESTRPDVIVVHACGATWRGIGPLVMDERMVAELLAFAPEATVVATHLDAVDHATVDRARLRAFFEDLPELRARLRIPDDGETLAFGPRSAGASPASGQR